MNATRPIALPAHLTVILTLARLLERLDDGQLRVDAPQYRSVVRHLAAELGKVTPDATLHALLDAHPAAAELYENLNYQHAGLCRSPLEASLNAELEARALLDRTSRGATRQD